MKNKNIFIAGLAVVAFASCKPNLDTGVASAGSMDLARYVAVGNSLTAGYADGSLYRSGQENSYPAILAQQFRIVGGGDFKTPFLTSENGFPFRKRVLRISVPCTGPAALGPVLEDSAAQVASLPANLVSIANQGPYNNTGVPGIRAIDYLVPGYPTLNPYSKRFFGSLGASPLAEINRLNATFFTAWIGNNDVLAYALDGGSGKGSDGTPFDQSSISSIPLFSMAVDSVLNRMTANGAKGAVVNIPDVTSIPYFNTIPAKGLNLTADDAARLNTAYAGTGMTFSEGANYWVIRDTTVPVIRMRQIRPGEYLTLTLPQDSLKCARWGSGVPIPMNYVLDAREVANVQTATTAFNNLLKAGAEKRGLAFVDMNTYLKTLNSGIIFNGVSYNATFVSGGAFSLDGIHLTPRGYAIAANEIIRTINSYYKGSIPSVDANKYDGIKYP
jgi:hypothetical protein